MNKTRLLTALGAATFTAWFFSSVALTQELAPKTADRLIESIIVDGVRQRLYKAGELKDSIAKTELLSAEQIKDRQAANLTEAIQSALGVRVSNECSMCGAKRVMINGLKGEHTNVLIDGIPLHTMLSGFYGLDAVAMAGIGSVDIARGAGASLIAPEAIGGTINMVTQIPTTNQIELDVAGGELGYQKASLFVAGLNQGGDVQANLVIQVDSRDQYDGDNNGVSESPYLDNQSITGAVSYDINYRTNLRLRVNHTRSEVFGGPVLGDTAQSIERAIESQSAGDSAQLFAANNVKGRYIGKPWETTEWVYSTRDEVIINLLHDFPSALNVTWSMAYIAHVQDSYYEGIDYYADDLMRYTDMRFNYELSDQHFLTFGIDNRSESMRSRSQALIDNPNYMADSFDYDVTGLYVQDSWTPTDYFGLELALRLDRVRADFIDSRVSGDEIGETLLSPRLDMRFRHNDDWQSRLSIGRGYRAPLSFFESDHGLLDSEKGYQVAVDQLERSIGYNYSLNYTVERVVSTLSVARTEVDHLATLGITAGGVPVLDQLDATARVDAVDWTLNYQMSESLNIGISAEQYRYNRTFKDSFGIAPIERRATLSGLWNSANWRITASASTIASRDLRDYNYSGYDNEAADRAKPQRAPSYINVDLKLGYRLTPKVEVYLGATNLLDYSQAKDESSPLLYDAEGGYDVTYIYAPLRGRTAYVGFDLDL